MITRPPALAVALRNVLTPLVFGVLPASLLALFILPTLGGPTFAYDFHGDLYGAAQAILHGRDPYDPALLARLVAVARSGGDPSTTFATPVYPAPVLLASVPLALLPLPLAGLVFAAVGLIAGAAALRLLGVADWRCYGAALLSWPLLHALRLGQVDELLLLATALVWRYRDRLLAPALAAAAAVAIKLFLWPLGIYLLLTRRTRAFAFALAATLLACLAGWAVIGFSSLRDYPRLLSDLASIEGSAGVSLRSLGAAAGVGSAVSTAAALLATALLLLAARRLAAMQREPEAYAVAIVAALAASPLVWPHYLVLLYAPIALLEPRLGPLWAVPLLAWAAPVELTHGDPIEILPYTAIALIVALAAARPLLRAGAGGPLANVPEAQGTTVRLGSGLESTSSRSYIAAQRPNKGPGEPHYTQVGDRLTPRTANRPT